jgi:large subunit GTPase 1
VQIVDARNPLGFRCEDLETYVKEVGTGNDSELKAGAGKRRNLLLVNKSDLLTESQR